MPDTATLTTVFDATIQPLKDAEVFADVTRTDAGVRCDAMYVEEECYYAAHADSEGNLWAGWYSPDRWVSGSIEGDLVHTGDKIDELLEEELVDLGLSIRLPLEHYRNDDKIFVFHGRLDLPSDQAQATNTLVKVLLAFQACFVELGDMAPGEDD
ncbi:MAG: hypothetical protein KTR15_07285 [Phycisphaeraceae bacterium]|nr:hypothetical protein [Phycisphaeraceae bacterium]